MEFEAGETTDACSGAKLQPPLDETEKFYQSLSKLHESSGLSFVFNLNKTILDLHLFYKQVIERGGFYQVTKCRKWDEVAMTLHLKSTAYVLPAQLQEIYEFVLLNFEQTYNNTNKTGSYLKESCLGPGDLELIPGCSTRKRKQENDSNPSLQTSLGDQGSKIINANSSKSYVNEGNGQIDAPLKPRTAYQIFVSLECDRLKTTHGENYSGSQTFRDIAIQSWKSLSEKEKIPYIEASKMEKEKYDREMMSYYKWQSRERMSCRLATKML